jgi:hypothetical protein
VGPVLVASTSTSVGFDAFTSNNQGTSWRRAEIRGLDQAPFEGLTTAGVPEMQDGQVTTDGRATWHEIVIDPPPRGDEGPYLSTPLEVPGGWLASASSSDVGDVNYGMLLRSNDGRPQPGCRFGAAGSSSRPAPRVKKNRQSVCGLTLARSVIGCRRSGVRFVG